jgi:hypothetical protein
LLGKGLGKRERDGEEREKREGAEHGSVLGDEAWFAKLEDEPRGKTGVI